MKSVIKRPLVTEKNTSQQENGVYVFEVDCKATKPEIRKAIEDNFQVKVDQIRTMQCRGRGKRNRLGTVKPKYWKKALIKLAAGDKIGLFEGV